jgi:uncharacterized protein (TIGR02996 family)
VNHEQAFLEDVIAHPDDDAPRLVFADWLEDHGDAERAEFIRLQCALARADQGDPRLPQMRAREQELLERYAQRWAEPLRSIVEQWAFRRGFIESVDLRPSSEMVLRERLEAAFRLAPVRDLRLEVEGGELPQVYEFPEALRRLRSLDLFVATEVEAEELLPLASPLFAGLTSLLLGCQYWEIPMEALREIVRSPVLAGLTELVLSIGEYAGDVEDTFLHDLAQTPHLTQLRRLDLLAIAFDVKIARALRRAPALAALSHLGLEGSAATEEAWRKLLWARSLDRLEWLGLCSAEVHQDGEFAGYLQESPLREEIERHFRPGVVSFDMPEQVLPRWSGHSW